MAPDNQVGRHIGQYSREPYLAEKLDVDDLVAKVVDVHLASKRAAVMRPEARFEEFQAVAFVPENSRKLIGQE